MKMLSTSQPPQRKKGVGSVLLLHIHPVFSQPVSSDGAALSTFLQTHFHCCSDMKSLDVQTRWSCCFRTQILHSQSSLALALIRQSAPATCEDLKSLIHHSRFPHWSISSFCCIWAEEEMPWFTLIPSRVTFLSFLWCQFHLKTIWCQRG